MKKNDSILQRSIMPLLKTLLLPMKLTVFLMLISVASCIASSAYSQKVSLNLRNARLSEAIEEITKQTNLHFAYSKDFVDLNRSVNISVKKTDLKIVLDHLLKGTALSHSERNGKIYIIPVFNGSEKPVVANQKQAVSGTIVDARTGEPLVGVSVVVDGSREGTITDSKGKFSLEVADLTGILSFSYIGYYAKKVPVSGKTNFLVQLSPEVRKIDEVVVVGYGTQKRSTVTGALSSVSGDKVKDAPVSNIINALGGNVSGVLVRNNSGEPGYDGADIKVRGIGTTGNASALVVVDGIPRNYSQLDLNSIETVTVLKDAASIAPYGVAGANGVILITTKRGHTGAPSVSLNMYMGWQRPTYLPKKINSYDYASLQNEAAKNIGQTTPVWSADALQKFKDHSDPDMYPDDNIFRDYFKLNTPMQNYNVQVSGGTDAVKYYTSFGYLNQEGMYSTSNYKKYNIDLALDIQATPTTMLSVQLNEGNELRKSPPQDAMHIMWSALEWAPTARTFFSNGLWGGYNRTSVWGEMYYNGYVRNASNTLFTQISLDQKLPFIKGLSVKGVFSYDPSTTTNKTWTTPIPYYAITNATKPYTYAAQENGSSTSLSQSYSESHNYTFQGYLNYHNTFGKHDITGLAVVESRKITNNNFGASRNNYVLNIDELSDGSSDKSNYDNWGTSGSATQLGLVYRAAYSYDSRYLLEVSGRYDGHYYFAPGKKWGFFPALSAGWRMSEEHFIKDNCDWIDNLKIRGSWGKSGNLAGGPAQYMNSYAVYNNAYAFNGVFGQGLYENSQANPDITWEVARKTDFGFESSFWKGLLSIEADYFHEKRSGMLLSPAVTVPAEYGIGLSQINAGRMHNRGIDLSVNSKYEFDNGIRVGLGVNFTYAKNALDQVYETDATYNNLNRRRTGRALNEKFGYKSLGLFTTAMDKNGDGIIDSADGYKVTQIGVVHPGDIIYADISRDGKIDSNDEVAIGKPDYPELIYGFTPTIAWKGFDVSALFQGAADCSVYVNGYETIPFFASNSAPGYEYYNNRWTTDHQNAKYPRATAAQSANNSATSDFYLRSGAYLRLKTLNVGYSIPKSVLNKASIQSCRLFVSGENLFTWSKIGFADPEYSAGGRYYMQQRVITIGANINF